MDPTHEAPAHTSYDEWQAHQRHALDPGMYPPFHPTYLPYGYYQPPPFIPIGEGPLGEAPRHLFITYEERTEDEEQAIEQGGRSDASGFFYTKQHYNEQMVFQNYIHASLAHNEQNWNDHHQWIQNTTQTLVIIQDGQDQVNIALNDIFVFLQILKEGVDPHYQGKFSFPFISIISFLFIAIINLENQINICCLIYLS